MACSNVKPLTLTCLIIGLALAGSSCSTMKTVFGVQEKSFRSRPIANPFGDFQDDAELINKNIVLRSKKGDESVEVEFPQGQYNMTDFVVPLSPKVSVNGRSLASGGSSGQYDPTYKEKKFTIVDREITRQFPKGSPQDELKRKEIEAGLRLRPTDYQDVKANKSYLASIDNVKQLFRQKRYEAGLLEVDSLVLQYPTDPRVYEMKGTLLDRLGYDDLALKSWKQALKLDPKNRSLASFIERKERAFNVKKGVASP